MKAVVAAFNQEKALVGAFSVITNLRMQLLVCVAHLGVLSAVLLCRLSIITGQITAAAIRKIPHNTTTALQ